MGCRWLWDVQSCVGTVKVNVTEGAFLGLLCSQLFSVHVRSFVLEVSLYLTGTKQMRGANPGKLWVWLQGEDGWKSQWGTGKHRRFLETRINHGELLTPQEVISLTENNHEVKDMYWGTQRGGRELCINPGSFSSFYCRYFKDSLLKKLKYSSSYAVKNAFSGFFEGSLQEMV